MVDECSGRGGRRAVALPTEILEVPLEKEEATREKLLEMAMPVMQRERLERLDLFDMRMGMSHFEVGVVLGALLDEAAMGRIALACHSSLDLLCDKTSSLPVVNGHVSVRNWPPPPYPHAGTESANVISLATANEPALMQYVLDGSTWSLICPFLDLLDTFNMRTTATTWNSGAKYTGGALLLFLLHNAP